MKSIFVLGLVAAACSAQAVTLYDNGSIVTGTSGANPISVIAGGGTTLGYTSSTSLGFSLADDFTVGAGGWSVQSLDFYAYQTSAVGFTFTNATWSIVSGASPSGAVVASGTTAVTSGGLVAYRVSPTTLTSTARAVYRINADITDVTLTAGNYWLTWSLAGTSTSGPFVPPTVAASGNAQQSSAGVFAPIFDATSLATAELPFRINGVAAVPEPATSAMMLLGSLAAVGAVRLRRQQA